MARKKKQEILAQPSKSVEKPRSVAKSDLAKPGAGRDTQSPDRFPIVGIGASAGGLSAFEAFFSGMPADVDPNMAFVLVQHLAPDHKSILADLIRRYTRMQVFEVEDGMMVRPNCAYIIPPGHDMAFLNGALQLLEPSAPRGQRLPIDFFFRSLAQDQHERAIGIVLSGTGSDGTLGVRAIKGEAGMVMAQNPESTEFDGMPRSAIATGLVDFELPPAEMPAHLIAYAAHAFGKLALLSAVPAPKTENALKKIFILLRSQTGHDFSQYKPSTINRRIERRMAVHQIETIEDYVKFLQRTPLEAEALFRDLLIGVTNFFRDPLTFQVLEEQVIPQIFADKHADGLVRVWSTGCSTGEEAYSIAILLQERMEILKKNYTVQVFATDIDRQAIATARAGLYPASIVVDLSPERLARFFTAEPGGGAYRIHKNIRDLLVFSEQNVIKDPPFSKLDLIICRNLLIYLGTGLQKRIIPLFHYALNPGGRLFLGTSEGVGDFADLFAVLDRKSKIYQRKDGFHALQRLALDRFLTPPTALEGAHPLASGKTAIIGKLPLRELTEQALLQQIATAGALVNGQGDILYLHGHTGMFLEPAPGETGINNIIKMAREGLRISLATALHKAVATKEIVHIPGLTIKTNGQFATINLSIRPVTPALWAKVQASRATLPEPPLFLVLLEDATAIGPAQTAQAALLAAGGGPNADEKFPSDMDAEARIQALRDELRAKDEYLLSTHEELESSNEELKSSNEEMQSVNEELQSTNEELETAKEEMQSVNEELATVNNELNTKVTDLSRVNNDMNNLLAGTGIATVFVDQHLRILRFTPTAAQIINLILADIGRPVGHIVSNLIGYDNLLVDVQAVLDTLIPKEMQVQAATGQWFTMRIRPYRTLDNVIEGVVITFVDISESKKMYAALQQNERMLRDSQAVAHIGAYITDLTATEFTTNTWQASPETYTIFGIDENYPHTLAGWAGLIHPDSRDELLAYHQKVVEAETRFEHQYKIRRFNDGEERWVQGLGELEYDAQRRPVKMVGTIQDITEQKLTQLALQAKCEEYQAINEELRESARELQAATEELQVQNEELHQAEAALRLHITDRKQAENALRETRAAYRTLMASLPAGVVVHGPDTGILFSNTIAQSLLGLTEEQMLGKSAIDSRWCFLREDGSSMPLEEYPVNRAMGSDEGFHGQILGIRLPDRAEPNWVLCNAVLVKAHGQIVQVVIAFTDITDRKRAEDALAKAAELLRLAVVVRDSPDAVTVQDLEGRTTAWNPGAARMYGWSEAEALLLNVRDRIPPALRKDALATNLRLARAEVLEPFRTQRITKDSAVVEITMTATALLNEAGEMYAIATTERLSSPMMSEGDGGTP